MKFIHNRFIQLLLVSGTSFGIGYFMANQTPEPESDIQVIEQVQGTPVQSLTDTDRQQQFETEILALQKHIALLEQELIDQQNADESSAANSQPGDIAEEKLTVENLIKAGVSGAVAEDIVQRMSQYEFQMLELHDRAKREGYAGTARFVRERRELMASSPSIQKTIGHENYDRYLYLTSQNNRVVVNQVMTNSPAEQLGVLKGDVILSYAEQKILSWRELRELTSQGVADEYVNLTVLRNEQLINILVPRGPLGVKLTTTRLDPGIQYHY